MCEVLSYRSLYVDLYVRGPGLRATITPSVTLADDDEASWAVILTVIIRPNSNENRYIQSCTNQAACGMVCVLQYTVMQFS